MYSYCYHDLLMYMELILFCTYDDFIGVLQLASNGFSAAAPVRRSKAAAHGGADGGADPHEAVAAELAKEQAAMAPEERVLHEWADEFAQDGLGLEP